SPSFDRVKRCWVARFSNNRQNITAFVLEAHNTTPLSATVVHVLGRVLRQEQLNGVVPGLAVPADVPCVEPILLRCNVADEGTAALGMRHHDGHLLTR